MELLIDVSSPDAGPLLLGLLGACRRRGTAFGLFFTSDGVRVLGDAAIERASRIATRAVVCEHSWHRFMAGHACPVETGSQMDHSLMAGQAVRIVAL